jgi:hypothetical protein
MKFKVGDKVTALGDVHDVDMKGKTGIVRVINKDASLPLGVEFEHKFEEGHNLHDGIDDDRGRFGREHEFKLTERKMKFKVGDKVEAIDDVDSLDMKGKQGTVRCIGSGSLPLGIEFDHDFDEGHSLLSSLNNHRGRFGDEDEFKLVHISKKRLPNAKKEDIEIVIDTFFDGERIFTKYDVTKQLRHDGFMTKHDVVRDVMDGITTFPFDYAKYTRDVNNQLVEIFCPDNKSVSTYDPNDVPEFDTSDIKDIADKVIDEVEEEEKDIKDSSGITMCIEKDCTDEDCDYHPIKFKDIPTKTAPIKVKKNNSLFDVKGRYSVKAKVTRNAGFKSGDELFIYAGKNNIAIVNIDVVKLGRKATVDCYSNIRVPKKVFETAFGSIPLSVTVNVRKDLIEISKNN